MEYAPGLSDKELRIEAGRVVRWTNGTRNEAIVVDGRVKDCDSSAGIRGGIADGV